jgi:threonyl-tRNA synthetase
MPSSQINTTLPDGSQREFEAGVTGLQIAEAIGARLARAAVAITVDGKLVDLSSPLDHDASVAIVTFSSAEGEEVYRHSTAHVLAQAVLRLFPEAKPTIGPPIAEGFYYDFDVPKPFNDEDLAAIEAEMRKIIEADLPFERQEVSADEARALFATNPYKIELIDGLTSAESTEPSSTISVYRDGDFADLCRGPHLPSTGRIVAFKLTSVAGAYWHGDEKLPMLSRIYGTSYPDKKALAEHLERIEEAKRRDHRVLGRDLDLFSFHEEAGAGLVYYHPRGAMLRRVIEDFSINEHLKRGYDIVTTPHLIKSDIWQTSGHAQQGYPMYYTEVDGQSYGIKPMNCPGHILIYKTKTRSYRDLPIRYFELGTVYRHELSGVLHGLLRVRGFTQDDAHIFCTPDQLEGEIVGVIDFARFMLNTFGFSEFKVFLSTRPEKSIGSDEIWQRATDALVQALTHNGLDYEIDEGGGAFYGPKIDIKIKDAIGRYWQGPTIQCDFTQPENFEVNYVGEDGQEHRACMVHRVVLAGIERFLALVIENCGGAFPVWLAPVQVMVLPIADRHQGYAAEVRDRLREAGFRAEADLASSTLNSKVRAAEMQKYPYMLVVGDKESEAGTVAVRHREEGDLGPKQLDEFIGRLREEAMPG